MKLLISIDGSEAPKGTLREVASMARAFPGDMPVEISVSASDGRSAQVELSASVDMDAFCERLEWWFADTAWIKVYPPQMPRHRRLRLIRRRENA